MRPPELEMYLSSSGLVPACPSLPPQCALSPGLYKMFECMPYVARVVGSECRGSEYVSRAPMQVRCLVACGQGYPCSMSN